MSRLLLFTLLLVQIAGNCFSKAIYKVSNKSRQDLFMSLEDFDFENLSMLKAVLLNEAAKRDGLALDELLGLLRFGKTMADRRNTISLDKFDVFMEMCKAYRKKMNSIRKEDDETMKSLDMQRRVALLDWNHGMDATQGKAERIALTVNFSYISFKICIVFLIFCFPFHRDKFAFQRISIKLIWTM